MIKNIIFDWGDTVMRDYPELPGAMCDWEHVELIPGVEPVLQDWSKKYTLIIATNAGVSDTEAMIRALKRVGVDVYFSHFFSSKELGVTKPDPTFFLQVCLLAEVSVNETIMIGNDYEKDIEGAKTAGLKTIFFNEKRREGDFPSADLIISKMEELILCDFVNFK